MMKIKSVEDIAQAEERILGHLVQGKLTYFSLLFGEESDISSCFFTPVTQLQKEGTGSMIMVDDYGKLLKVLLSHPNISRIEYDEKENMISAVFECPFEPDWGGCPLDWKPKKSVMVNCKDAGKEGSG